MPNGTLADHLHKLGTPLSWLQRLKICIGAARGLDYLHTGTGIDVGVTHRDVKSSNILLTESWAARISDFGLSKIGPTNQPSTYVNTLVKGTFGYLDPDYSFTGRLTRKSDVYALGVILLEVLCRKPALDRSLDEEQQNLARWGQECIKEGNLKRIIDSGIKGEISQKCLKKFVQVVEICLHSNPKRRPTMAEVVVTLESVMTMQEKINRSLQDAGKTIFGRMLDMFIFSSNGDNPEKINSSLQTVGTTNFATMVDKLHVPSNKENSGVQMGINNDVTEADESKDSVSPSGENSGVSFYKEEWIEQYQPGVHIILGTLHDGTREVKRVRFSRRRFGEKGAETWWSENYEQVGNTNYWSSDVQGGSGGGSMIHSDETFDGSSHNMETISSSVFDKLTDELLIETLIRLPLKPANICKCISVRFRSLISSSNFVRCYLNHHQINESFALHYDLDGKRKIRPSSVGMCMAFESPGFSLSFLQETIQYLASNNGLVLCCADLCPPVVYFVCNPLTKQSITLPPPPTDVKATYIGFTCNPQYSCNDNQEQRRTTSFKVVRIQVALRDTLSLEILFSFGVYARLEFWNTT
ncbi:unnamed protein product [Lactuca saligna]|uniref:Protein kinase domain-containing protein n=1 Tax=Lactuca saligna TaxID=75948 RepID=A0AA35ZEY2_LACSI|nr:unnamed protein product [Lactuca saligna]